MEITGLKSLMILGKYNNTLISEKEVYHRFSIDNELKEWEIIKIAKHYGLRGKRVKVRGGNIKEISPPFILKSKNGEYSLYLGKKGSSHFIYDVLEERSKGITDNELERVWEKEVIVIYKKWKKISNEVFGIKWFLPTFYKYKKSILEVLLAVLTVQILGVLSPIIMQVIIDKVLIHKSLSTLNVLAMGLLTSIVFEYILSLSRTYIFSNVTSKIDVILNAKLFNHLFKLPLRYFEERRVGDTVTRVRELENIRRFLTGTPLTLILDLLFIFIYIGVMYFYSKVLTNVILGSFLIYIFVSLVITPILRERLNIKYKI